VTNVHRLVLRLARAKRSQKKPPADHAPHKVAAAATTGPGQAAEQPAPLP